MTSGRTNGGNLLCRGCFLNVAVRLLKVGDAVLAGTWAFWILLPFNHIHNLGDKRFDRSAVPKSRGGLGWKPGEAGMKELFRGQIGHWVGPRFFESLVVGRVYDEVAPILMRISLAWKATSPPLLI